MKNLFTLCLLIAMICGFGSVEASSDPISTDIRPTTPTEIYGPQDANIELVLGNGGAGPTCLLQELSEDFISHTGSHIQIAWIQTITRLTLENLKEKVIDISFTYEEPLETIALQEGWASDRTLVFNDHFILIGPKSNPAKIDSSDSVEEAFRKISKSHSPFFSRDDLSGTNERERDIWSSINLKPWEERPEWYIAQQVFPAENVKRADEEGLYTLTDRGTLLSLKDQLSNTAVYIQNGEILMNRCHAMLQNNPSYYAQQFLKYLKSERAQNLINNYAGKNNKYCNDCCPLFTRANKDQFLEQDCLNKLGFSPLPSSP